MTDLSNKEKKELINNTKFILQETTLISLSVVVLIVAIAMYIVGIAGQSSANAGRINENRKSMETTRAIFIKSSQENRQILYEISERLGRIEGELKGLRSRPQK
jgi:hypothetical protein